MKFVLLVLSITSVLVISGCASIPNLFGGDVVSVQTKTVENGVRDVIAVKDVQTIPRSPLLPDQSMLLTFIIENRDELHSARAYVDLFNAPTIHSETGTLCNLYVPSGLADLNFCCAQNDNALCDDGTGRGYCIGTAVDCPSGYSKRLCGTQVQTRSCSPDACDPTTGCDILPHEEKPISYNLRTPSESDIKNIKTDVKLSFKVGYSFSGSLNMLLPAVNMEEIIKRQRSGDRTELAITKSYGSGPVQIDAEIQGAPYIISNTGPSKPESVILFTLRDRGSGDLVGSRIESGAMTVRFPTELEVMPASTTAQPDACTGGQFSPNDKFCCSYTGSDTVCTNNRGAANGNVDLGVIPLYLKESRSSLRFAVRTRNALEEPFRSMQVTSDVAYSYEVRGSADVTINPFQNV